MSSEIPELNKLFDDFRETIRRISHENVERIVNGRVELPMSAGDSRWDKHAGGGTCDGCGAKRSTQIARVVNGRGDSCLMCVHKMTSEQLQRYYAPAALLVVRGILERLKQQPMDERGQALLPGIEHVLNSLLYKMGSMYTDDGLVEQARKL